MAQAKGPLDGMKVIELAHIMAGPVCGMMLADMGADVIKIETTDGDLMRHYLPNRNPLMSGITLNLDRNKRSLALDLKSEEGIQTLMDLTATADVFVTNMRKAALDRLGITYERVIEAKPDIVFCAAIGFDSDGPWAGRPAYDDVIQAMSGQSPKGLGKVALRSAYSHLPKHTRSCHCPHKTNLLMARATCTQATSSKSISCKPHARRASRADICVPSNTTLVRAASSS